MAAGLVVFVIAAVGAGAQSGAPAACRVAGRVTSAGVPLPGVSVAARDATGASRLSSTSADGTYHLALPQGVYDLSIEFSGFTGTQHRVTISGDGCTQTFDAVLTLLPRTAARPAPGTLSAGRGRSGGPAPQPFQALAITDAAAGVDAAGDVVTAPQLLLPPGFEVEASADAIAITGQAARVDRGALGDRADALAGGGFPFADLTAALALGDVGQGQGLPPDLAARLGGAGGRGGRGGFAQGDGGGRGGDFTIGGRGGRGGNRLQATADYSFGGSMLDSAPYQLRGDVAPAKRPYTRQTFGTTLGGPFKIPGVYRNAANRTSVTASYNASRGSTLFDQYATVPTDQMRAGDFSSSGAPLIDPATGRAFSGNQIPDERVSAAARALLALLPSANLPGTTRNYHYTTTTASVSDTVNARLNHTFGGGAAFAGRGGRGGRGGGGGRGGRGGRGAAAPRPTLVALNIQFQFRRNEGDQTNVFSTLGGRSTTTNVGLPIGVNVTRARDLHAFNVQMSSTRSTTTNHFTGVENVAGLAGIQGITTDPFAWGVPALSFSSVTSLRDVTPSRRSDARLSLSHTWTRPIGRHSMRVGSSLQMDRGTTRTDANANGSFVFTGLYASGGTAAVRGFDVADFLLGLPQQATVQYGPGDVTLHGRSLSLFVQDDWRARGNVTLNAGLRYELLWPFVEENGQLVNLDVTPDFSAATPVMAGAAGPYSGAYPAALLLTDTNNLAPRVGVAWRARQGTTLRGGYGVSYNSGAYAGFARQLSSQPPFAVTNTQIGALNSILLMEQALTGGSPTETTNTFGVDRDYALGRVQTWNADVQHAFGRSWTASAGYTHTRGASLDVVRAPNRDAAGLRIEGVQPFLWQSSEGSSVLHSANFGLQRRQVRGVAWGVTYALARSRDNAPSIGGGTVVAQDDRDIDAEWGLSNFDRRHRVTVNANVELPFGPNRRWLTNGGVWASVLENWRLTANFVAESGTPLSARVRASARDVSQGQNGALRADYNGQPIAIDGASIDRYFNTDAFSIPGAGLFGSSARNLIIGPGARQLDAQVARDVSLGGTRAVTIQVRATNLLNLVNYTAVDTFVNSPTFGQVSSVRPMRSAQLNVRFRF